MMRSVRGDAEDLVNPFEHLNLIEEDKKRMASC